MVRSATAGFFGGKSGASAAPSGGGDSLTSGLLLKFALAVATVLVIIPAAALAQTQSHPLSQISPVDTDLNLNSRNITALNYLLYSGGIFYSGSQGIPTADIATSAVTGAKIAAGVVTASKISNPLGGSMNASAYYDSDNSNYYFDPASVGTSLVTSGKILANNATTHIDIVNPTMIVRKDGTTTSGEYTLALQNLDTSSGSGSRLVFVGLTGNGLNRMYAQIGSFVGTNVATQLRNSEMYFVTSDGSGVLRERMRIDGSGEIGIGTSSPESLLHVNGTNPDIRIHNSGNSWGESEWKLLATSAVGTRQLQFLGASDGGAFAQILTLGTNGRVGIGIGSTNTPQRTLDVVGTVNFTQSSANDFLAVFNNTNALGSSGGLKVQTVGGARALDVVAGYGPAAAFMNGKVGIGTIAPVKTLDVVGDLNVTGTIYGTVNSTTGGLNCDQCVDTTDIANSAVTSAKIANGAVTSTKLSNPLGGSVNASAYYDSDNSNYFLDLASIGTSLTVAGGIGINTTSLQAAGGLDIVRRSASAPNNPGGYGLSIRSGGNNGLTLGDFDTFKVIQSWDSSPLSINPVGGNVGIGATDPVNRLNVIGDNTGASQRGAINVSLSATDDFVRGLTVVQPNLPNGVYGAGLGFGRTSSSREMAFWFFVPNATSGFESARLNFHSVGDVLTVQGDGKVGIGTTSPTGKVHIQDDSIAQLLMEKTGSNTLALHQDSAWSSRILGGAYFDGTNTVYGQTGRSAFRIMMQHDSSVGDPQFMSFSSAPNGVKGETITWTEHMRINRNGRIGVNTTSPSYTLDVRSPPASALAFRVYEGSHDYMTVGATTTLKPYPSTGSAVRIQGMNSGGSFFNMVNVINNQVNNNPVVALAQSTGRVGVGTSSPDNLLHVQSSGSSVDTDSAEILRVQNSGSATSAARISIIGGNAGESAVRFGDTDSRAVGAIYYNHAENSMAFWTNAGQRMVIDSSGLVNFSSEVRMDPFRIGPITGWYTDLTHNLYFSGGWRNLNQGPGVRINPGGGANTGGYIAFQVSDGNLQTAAGTLVNLNTVLYLDNQTRVGIGTSNPQTRLDIGTNPALFLQGNSNNWGFKINVTDYGDGNVPLIFNSRGSGVDVERMRITHGGFVGINNTNPSSTLHVTGVITATTKNFEIDHPTKEGYALVHSAIEGPEIAVYYRGTGSLSNGTATIVMPEYFDVLTVDNTATVILTARGPVPFILSYDGFDEKSFTVYGSISEGEFDWEVKAIRADVAPLVVEKPKEVAQ